MECITLTNEALVKLASLTKRINALSPDLHLSSPIVLERALHTANALASRYRDGKYLYDGAKPLSFFINDGKVTLPLPNSRYGGLGLVVNVDDVKPSMQLQLNEEESKHVQTLAEANKLSVEDYILKSLDTAFQLVVMQEQNPPIRVTSRENGRETPIRFGLTDTVPGNQIATAGMGHAKVVDLDRHRAT